jgi:hypothetical protein
LPKHHRHRILHMGRRDVAKLVDLDQASMSIFSCRSITHSMSWSSMKIGRPRALAARRDSNHSACMGRSNSSFIGSIRKADPFSELVTRM